MAVLDNLKARPEIAKLDECPTFTEIRTASRRLRFSAGGVDGLLRPEHLKAVCQDNDLFRDCVAKHVVDFWEDLRVPKTWEICDANLLFKKGDASNPGNYRTIMKLVVQEKLVLTVIGDRLNTVIESLGAEYETQCGFRGNRGCIDAIFNLRLALRKRKEHGHASWVAFLDLVKAFDTISREMLWVVLRKLGCPDRFVARIKALHDEVIVLIRKGDAEIRCNSYGGVRQGDILGPPLFNLYMAAVLLTFKELKQSEDCTFLTSSAGFIFHGVPRTTKGDVITVNEMLYADDTAAINGSRAGLVADLKTITSIFSDFGMKMHEGAPGIASKTEAMYFAKQRARYEDYSTFDGADRSVLVLDLITDPTKPSPGYRLVPFSARFCYLGSILDEKLDDLTDVNHRLQKACMMFGRFRKNIFVGNRLSRKSKKMMYLALVVSSALYGCESWSVTAEIERRLQSMQTKHCAQMLGVRLPKQIAERISARTMRRSMGMHNILDIMRCLQLNWAGRVRRMEPDRLPRQLLNSWMPDRRLSNYNQSYSRTLLKALRSIGVEESDFPALAENQTEWNHYCRQTVEMRNDLRRAHNCDDEMILAALDECGLEHTAATFRRMEFSLCGCVFTHW